MSQLQNHSHFASNAQGMKRGFQQKAALTPREKLKAAYFHYVHGLDPHLLADFFNVKPARVDEAISEIRKAVGLKEKR
jgi:hypothetical protein